MLTCHLSIHRKPWAKVKCSIKETSCVHGPRAPESPPKASEPNLRNLRAKRGTRVARGKYGVGVGGRCSGANRQSFGEAPGEADGVRACTDTILCPLLFLTLGPFSCMASSNCFSQTEPATSSHASAFPHCLVERHTEGVLQTEAQKGETFPRGL